MLRSILNIVNTRSALTGKHAEGVPHTLLIGGNYKIRTGCSYRFYFLSPPDSLKKDSPWLEKAMLADSLLGMELLENVPVSGTASPSNMDL